ncbi:MAG TPA: APC family permease [Gammaproteobacteria bacterium]|nr:APC family permease [Gammaproteobacteria bacterium]
MINKIKRKPGSQKALSVFALVMINVIAVDSLRNLTMGAEYGLALIFFYGLAALLFFLPTLLVTAELATGWPITGGSYVWVREAFGPRIGFLAIWLQWIYNVVWYPTIFAFIAGILAHLIHPEWVNNQVYMVTVVLVLFWSMTFVNCFGLSVSSWVSTVGAIFGTLLPMLLIVFLGFIWLLLGKPSQIDFSASRFLPDQMDLKNLAFMTNVLFGLMGMEMSAVHAGDVQEPAKDYPRALGYSCLIILATLIFASLAITIVVPLQELNLVSGLIDAFAIFFKAFQLPFLIPVVAILIVIGSMSGAAAWIIGPARGLWVASDDSKLPLFFKKVNKKKMPIGILLLQGLIVTLLCALFFVMPSVKSSYWLLSNLTAQLALLFYILLFSAALRLHHKCIHVKRAFKIPGGAFGIWLVCGTGILTCVTAIVLGFLPPTQVDIGQVGHYEAMLVLGVLACCLPPFFFHAFYKRKFKREQ